MPRDSAVSEEGGRAGIKDGGEGFQAQDYGIVLMVLLCADSCIEHK